MNCEIVGEHVDAGMSGSRADNRPGLQEALDLACKEQAALIVYSLSRLARSTKDALSIAEKLDKAGADLVSLSEQIDTTSAAGKMVFRILAVLSEFERDLVSERTRTALAHKRENGYKTGGAHAPFGFEVDSEGRLVKNSKEQRIIKTIFRMRDKGLSFREIGAVLEKRGIPTKTGATWNPKTVKCIVDRGNGA
jgi:DNA invertase Pin-like site-specific DNA recombinase